MKNLYNNQKDTAPLRESPQFAVPIVVAVLQIIVFVSIIFLYVTTRNKGFYEGGAGVIWLVVPLFIGMFTVPLNLVTGPYYFWRYRDDPPQRKWLVGVSLGLSLLTIIFGGAIGG